MWHMAVSYEHSKRRKVLASALVATVVLAFLVSALVFTILNQRRVHQEQLKDEASKRLADAKEAYVYLYYGRIVSYCFVLLLHV